MLGRVRLLQSQGLQPTRLLCQWDCPGKNTGVNCHFLLQGIFSIQGSKPHLHGRQILYHWATGKTPFAVEYLIRRNEWVTTSVMNLIISRAYKIVITTFHDILKFHNRWNWREGLSRGICYDPAGEVVCLRRGQEVILPQPHLLRAHSFLPQPPSDAEDTVPGTDLSSRAVTTLGAIL